MAETRPKNSENLPRDIAENAGERAKEVTHNPAVTNEEAENAAAGEKPNAAGSVAPSTAENYVPSSSESESTDLPSSR